MGDMADMLLGSSCLFDEWDRPSYAERLPKTKTCKCCGQTGLRWVQEGAHWRLYEQGKIHVCSVRPLSVCVLTELESRIADSAIANMRSVANEREVGFNFLMPSVAYAQAVNTFTEYAKLFGAEMPELNKAAIMRKLEEKY